MMDHFTANYETSHNNRLRRAFLLASIPAVILAAKMAESAEVSVPLENGGSWTIEITPRQTPANTSSFALQDQPGDTALPPAPPQPFPVEVALAQAKAAPEGVVEHAVVKPTEDFGVTIIPNRKFKVNGLTYRQVYDSIPFSRSEYLANPSYRHDAAMEMLTGIPRQSVHASYEAQLNNPTPPHPEFLYNRYGTFGGTFGSQRGGFGGYGGWGYYPQYAPAFRYFLPLNIGY